MLNFLSLITCALNFIFSIALIGVTARWNYDMTHLPVNQGTWGWIMFLVCIIPVLCLVSLLFHFLKHTGKNQMRYKTIAMFDLVVAVFALMELISWAAFTRSQGVELAFGIVVFVFGVITFFLTFLCPEELAGEGAARAPAQAAAPPVAKEVDQA